jgi:DHA1 family bicyclomycin/chloramphenicol resistance-like MFS transporter
MASLLFVFVSWFGLIITNSIAGAFADFPQGAGSVSALVGAIHYGFGMVGSGMVGYLTDGTPQPLGFVIAVAGVGCFVCAQMTRA